MKIINSPDSTGMTCVLPNGVTVEVEMVSMEGLDTSNEQDIDQVRDIVEALPESFIHST